VLFLQHGALWLGIKTGGALQARATRLAALLWPLVVLVAVAFLMASWFKTNLYANYLAYPALFAVIAITVLALLAVRFFIARQAWFKAWFASALTIVGATFFGVIGLFPNLFPSSLDAVFNLTARNASSSPLTLKIMLVVAIIFVPIVLIYQAWSYNLFKHGVLPADLAQDETY
jgi:cytochrome d ubiquinol oxidase subunit II